MGGKSSSRSYANLQGSGLLVVIYFHCCLSTIPFCPSPIFSLKSSSEFSKADLVTYDRLHLQNGGNDSQQVILLELVLARYYDACVHILASRMQWQGRLEAMRSEKLVVDDESRGCRLPNSSLSGQL